MNAVNGTVSYSTSFDSLIITGNHPSPSVTGNWSLLWQNDQFSGYMYGATSGQAIVYQVKREEGYFATISATSVQTKQIEWSVTGVTITNDLTISTAGKKVQAPILQSTLYSKVPAYANLAAIAAAITSPASGMQVYVTGQGMAVYTGAAWRKMADEAVAIT